MRRATLGLIMAAWVGCGLEVVAADGNDVERESIIGCWQAVDDTSQHLLCEPERVLFAGSELGVRALPVASFTGRQIRVPDLGQALPGGASMPYTVEGDTLRIHVHPFLRPIEQPVVLQLVMKRITATPQSLTLQPMELGEVRKLPAVEARAITRSLEQRMERDQAARQSGAYGAEAIQAQVDDERWLRDTISAHGWIDVRRFGGDAAKAAFLIAQHSADMQLRLAAEQGLYRDLKAGQGVQGLYAWLRDRNGLYTTGRQRYGTHFRFTAEAVEILRLEDADQVDRWRREIGMPALSRHEQGLRGSYPQLEVRVQE